MNILNCNPTELRHLIGRIGEFICALQTNGTLARQTNHDGFDVVSNSRRISVKTTAQLSGFIPINQNTNNDFDDFNIIYFGPKEEVKTISKVYGGKYEVSIGQLKKLNREYQFNKTIV
ncbi:hypothetical protein STFR1_30014 [Bacillus vallismortis]